MSLHKLCGGDGLQNIRDLYGLYKNTLSDIMKKFCRTVRKYLQHVFVQTPNESQCRI